MRASVPPNQPAGQDPHAERRRRIAFRAGRRGTHENDLLLGRFAEAHLAAMDVAELDAFEAILDLPDVELFDWIAGRAAVPVEHDSVLLRRLVIESRGR
jgi:antitoxin CptB